MLTKKYMFLIELEFPDDMHPEDVFENAQSYFSADIVNWFETKGSILINVRTNITPEAYEKLEEALRDCIKNFGVSATIEDMATGNTTVTDDREEEEL